MVHLLAVNTQFDIYLKTITPTNISKDFDIEKELETKSKSNTENDCSDSEIDEFFQNINQINKNSISFLEIELSSINNFLFCENAFPQVHFEIPIPPPDASYSIV